MNLENFYQQLSLLPRYLSGHLQISIIALLAGIAISIPLAVIAVRSERLRYPLMTAVGIIQTIPSLALLALMVAISGQLGFYPTIVALTLYSILPILRNAVTGITGVDPALKEAARGVGMTAWQSLYKVELPLAMPVIIAGIRTATVWTVGIATLATPVGQICLGNYIFSGLQIQDWMAVIFGCVASATLAVILDLLIGRIKTAVEEQNRTVLTVCLAILAMISIGGIASPMLLRGGSSSADRITVGAKTFQEQFILARLVESYLTDAELPTNFRESLGSAVVFEAVKNGSIDVYVDYTGTIWSNYMKRSDSASRNDVYRQVSDWLASEFDVTTVGPLGFQNSYALAMRRDQAERLGIKTIADLARQASQLKIGSDVEFFSRPEWKSLRDTYGLKFASQTPFDSTFMYEAIRNGEVDVISAFSSDGRVAAYDLITLEDPEQAIPPYDAVILISPDAPHRERIVELLTPIANQVTVENMRKANYMVDRSQDSVSPNEAANWLGATIAPSESQGEQ